MLVCFAAQFLHASRKALCGPGSLSYKTDLTAFSLFIEIFRDAGLRIQHSPQFLLSF